MAKESIFAGLNNFKVHSLTSVDFDEYFGFTDWEVREMLHYYGQDEHYEAEKNGMMDIDLEMLTFIVPGM